MKKKKKKKVLPLETPVLPLEVPGTQPLEVPGDIFETKILKFRWFLGPSDGTSYTTPHNYTKYEI